jgi:hypothetical protein
MGQVHFILEIGRELKCLLAPRFKQGRSASGIFSDALVQTLKQHGRVELALSVPL